MLSLIVYIAELLPLEITGNCLCKIAIINNGSSNCALRKTTCPELYALKNTPFPAI